VVKWVDLRLRAVTWMPEFMREEMRMRMMPRGMFWVASGEWGLVRVMPMTQLKQIDMERMSRRLSYSLFIKYPSSEVQNGLKFNSTIPKAIGMSVNAHTYVTKHAISKIVLKTTIFICP
jgi:hypothetical protein